MKKHAIITFDYEVFLGRDTGTVENCVIRPTEDILKILEENNGSAVFFVDATWLLFIKENFYDDFQKVAVQLKKIIAKGSSVELHLHPQWLDAARSDGRIVFNSFANYKLQSLEDAEIIDMFKRSIEILEGITDQKVSCFRAGGWCIEPFGRIKDAFKTFDIKSDFSVVPGAIINEGKVYDYDFSKVPRLPFYKFEDTVTRSEENGSFIEVPVSTYQNNPVYRILNKLLLRSEKNKNYGDGKGIKVKTRYETISNVLKFTKGMLTLDNTSSLVFKYLITFHFRKLSFLIVVSHPKTLSRTGLENLKYILKKYNTLNSAEFFKYFQNSGMS